MTPAAPTERLLTYDELKEWQKDNQDIRTGYRRELRSYYEVYRSLYAYFHNETINIWSHLLGAVVSFISLLAPFLLSQSFSLLPAASPSPSETIARLGYLAPFSLLDPFPTSQHPSVHWSDTLVISIFLVSATLCLTFSASYHALSAHSEAVAKRYHQMDYVGIAVLISGTFVPAAWYGLYCRDDLRNLYLALIAVSTSATIVATLSPQAATPAYRRFRAAVFVSLGLSSTIPIVHGFILFGSANASERFALPYLAIGGVLYIVGAILYAERCPERLKPGKFDLVGASHQIFHCMILLAAWAHYCAITEAFRFRHWELEGVCG